MRKQLFFSSDLSYQTIPEVEHGGGEWTMHISLLSGILASVTTHACAFILIAFNNLVFISNGQSGVGRKRQHISCPRLCAQEV